MMMVAVKRATYQDIVDLPPHQVGQIIDGELFVHPRPAMPHSDAGSNLGGILGAALSARARGTGRVDHRIRTRAPLRRRRLGPRSRGLAPRATPGATACALPDPRPRLGLRDPLALDRQADRTKNFLLYARQGVRHAWIVDPLERTLEVLRLEGGRWSILCCYADDAVVRVEPFEVIELSLALVFSR